MVYFVSVGFDYFGATKSSIATESMAIRSLLLLYGNKLI